MAAPWGLPHLSGRELNQLGVANNLMLNGLRWEMGVSLYGGSSFMEHPDEAPDPEASSVWRTALHRYFMEVVLGAVRVPIEQWQYGAPAKKPTLLRSLRLPGMQQGMVAQRDPHAPLPSSILKGYDQERQQFRTAEAKEYPWKMNRAMALSALDALDRNRAIFGETLTPFEQLDISVQAWIHRMLNHAESHRTERFLPHYQL